MRNRSLLLVVPLLVAAAACSGDDDGGGAGGLSEADQELADALTAKFDADDDAGFGEVFDTGCMGRGVVVALGGADAIEADYGITVDNVADVDDTPLDQADAEAVVDAYRSCGDFREVLTLGFTESGVPPELAACVAEALADETITASLVENFVLPSAESGPANTRLAQEASAAAVECEQG